MCVNSRDTRSSSEAVPLRVDPSLAHLASLYTRYWNDVDIYLVSARL
jgi:hypothetical protein